MSYLRLVINSSLGDVSLVAVAVHRVCVYLGLDEVHASQVELCIAEAATNAIRHAYHGESGRAVSISVSTDVNRLHIEVCDSGTPMSTEQVEKLVGGAKVVEVDGTDRASLREGGRGLQIIHDLMDEVAYIRDGNLNCLQLTKRILPDRVD